MHRTRSLWYPYVGPHETSTCTSTRVTTGGRGGRGGRGTDGGRGGGGREGRGPATAATSHARGLRTNISRDAFRAHVTTRLQNGNGSFGDDVTGLVDEIVNHMYNPPS